jgi:hypothetical protein
MTLFLSFLFSTCTCFLLSDTAHWVLSGLIHAVTVVFHRHDVFKTVREYLNTWSLTDQHTPSNCPDKCPPSQFLSVHAHALLFLQLHLPILRHHCCHRLVLPTTYRPPPKKKSPRSPSSSSASDSPPHTHLQKMPSIFSKFQSGRLATVDQESNSKPPYMHVGDPSPQTCINWERACKCYANNKDIPTDKIVKRTLDGFEDVCFVN